MTLSNDALWLVTGIHSCTGLIIAPLLSYFLYQFYKRKDDLFIAKRYPFLVIKTTILTIAAQILWSPFSSLRQISPLEHTNSLYLVFARIQNICHTPLVYAVSWLFITRVWLISYDLNYANSNMNKKWKSYLDPTLVAKDFWLKHRNTYGNSHYVMRFTFAATAIYCTISWISVQLYLGTDKIVDVETYLHVSLHLSVVIILIALYIRLPHVLDLFYLRFEVKMFAIILILGLLWISIMMQIVRRVHSDIIAMIALVLKINGATLTYLAMDLTSTWWILRKLDGGLNNSSLKQINRQNVRELNRVLLDSDNFELFVQHLAREFCIESVLSFIEMVQFKHLIESRFDLHLGRTLSRDGVDEFDIADKELFYDFDRCDINQNTAIPKSFIVYKSDLDCKDYNDLGPFLIIAHKLCSKYLVCGAELEINISGEMRESYLSDMQSNLSGFMDKKLNSDDPMEAIDLFEYFDECIEEMYCLLSMSCDRFLETDKNVTVARIHLTNYDTNQINKTLKGAGTTV
eukprot:72825_1